MWWDESKSQMSGCCIYVSCGLWVTLCFKQNLSFWFADIKKAMLPSEQHTAFVMTGLPSTEKIYNNRLRPFQRQTTASVTGICLGRHSTPTHQLRLSCMHSCSLRHYRLWTSAVTCPKTWHDTTHPRDIVIFVQQLQFINTQRPWLICFIACAIQLPSYIDHSNLRSRFPSRFNPTGFSCPF